MATIPLIDANGNPISCGTLDVAGDPTAFDGNPVVELQDDGTFALAEQVVGMSPSAGWKMNTTDRSYWTRNGDHRENGYEIDGRPGTLRPVDINGVTYHQVAGEFYEGGTVSPNAMCVESTNRIVHHEGPVAFSDTAEFVGTYVPYWKTEGNSAPIAMRLYRDPYITVLKEGWDQTDYPATITARIRIAVVTFDDAGYDGTAFTFTNPQVLTEYDYGMLNWTNEPPSYAYGADARYFADDLAVLDCVAGISTLDLRTFIPLEFNIPDATTKWSLFGTLEYDGDVDPFEVTKTFISPHCIEQLEEGGF